MAGAREVASFGVKFLSDEAGFHRALSNPVLLWESPPATKEQPLLFSTRPAESPRPSPGRAVFFEVVKSAKNAFAVEVTLGRTVNNDISIDDNSVSRFHAYLAPAEGAWSLVDAKSTSGTFVRGKKLEPRVPHALLNGARFQVGSVELQFLEPASFYAYLKGLIRQK